MDTSSLSKVEVMSTVSHLTYVSHLLPESALFFVSNKSDDRQI